MNASAGRGRVAVLMGGPGEEREVSLRSGANVADGLRTAGFEVTEIRVDTDALPHLPEVDAVFIALHGRFGEDGQVQELLDARGIPYTGPGAEASRLCFDKIATKRRLDDVGIPTPAWTALDRADAPPPLAAPLVVKPARQGSSIGMTIVQDLAAWPAALAEALRFPGPALAEAFVPGRELTVGVVGDEAFPVVEIRPRQGVYDYTSKYTAGLTDYLAPAPLPPEVADRCRHWALETFRATGCTGMARVDFRWPESGEPQVLEINTIPGFTATSLLPKSAAAGGLGFADLCARVVDLARAAVPV